MALPTYDEVIAKWDPVLGLEVHVELNTASKMFCSCATEFGAAPNTQTCPVCLALPGALPVVNEKAIESTILIGLALNCKIAPYSRFARKNYFYPDMPKNFQISQYDEPICFDGYVDVEIDTEEGPKQFRIEVERVHMEEDTGKSLHVGGATGRILALTIHSLTTTAQVFHLLKSLPRLFLALASTLQKLPRHTLPNCAIFCVV